MYMNPFPRSVRVEVTQRHSHFTLKRKVWTVCPLSRLQSREGDTGGERLSQT